MLGLQAGEEGQNRSLRTDVTGVWGGTDAALHVALPGVPLGALKLVRPPWGCALSQHLCARWHPLNASPQITSPLLGSPHGQSPFLPPPWKNVTAHPDYKTLHATAEYF